MAIDLPEPYHRGLFASHTFTCALTTRGGICDCLPPPASEAGPTVALVGTNTDQPSATSAPSVSGALPAQKAPQAEGPAERSSSRIACGLS